MPMLSQIRSILGTLNPDSVESLASRPFVFGVHAFSREIETDMLRFLGQRTGGPEPRSVLPIRDEKDFGLANAGFSEPGFPRPAHFAAFDRRQPERAVSAVLAGCSGVDDWLPLARRFPCFRREVSERLIRKVSRENALFSVATGVPNVVPAAVLTPWVVGEFASDTLALTTNQIRLCLLLAAAHGDVVTVTGQVPRIASIIGAAFGWRSLARQLVSKVPGGYGLVPKGVVAYAGTYAVGRALEHWLREGYPLDRKAARDFYRKAKLRGRGSVERIVESVVRPQPTVVESG